MAHLLFAAHDPGAANMLLPVMPLARERGHRTSALAAGPAAAVWRDAGEVLENVGDNAASRERFRRLKKKSKTAAKGWFPTQAWTSELALAIQVLARIKSRLIR